MKKTRLHLLRFAVGLLMLLSTLHPGATLLAQGTAFTYQGRLDDTNGPVTGTYDLRFTLYDQLGGASPSETLGSIPITNGLFTVTLDFGGGVFVNGGDRFLQIDARPFGTGSYVTLSPRQKLTPIPYAITAENVLSGGLAAGVYTNALSFNNPANSFCGDGSCLLNVNAAALGGLTSGDFWRLNGNTASANSFLGTLNSLPLEIKVNNTHALRIMPAAIPSLEGGYSGNSAHGFSSAAIVGGGSGGAINEVLGDYGFVGAGSGNQAGSSSGVVSGGNNAATGQNSLIGGGVNNTNLANSSVIAGGAANHITVGAINAFVGAGVNNSALGGNTVVAGGANNIADVNAAGIGGGSENHAGGDHSYIGGGQGSVASAAYTTIGGGSGNAAGGIGATIGGGQSSTIQSGAANSVIGGGQGNLIQTNSMLSVIAGGKNNLVEDYLNVTTTAPFSAISGGEGNTISPELVFPEGPLPLGDHSVIGGGYSNTITASQSVISGGANNNVSGSQGVVIGGGANNSARGGYSTIPGGQFNLAAGAWSFAAGYRAQAINNGTFVWADSQNADFASTGVNQFLIRAAGGVGINTTNPAVALDVGGTARVQGANNWNVTSSEGDFRVGNDAFRFKVGVATNGGGAGDVWMRAHGGTGRFFIKTPGGTTIFSNEGETSGVSLPAGGGAWSALSDRNAKENFAQVDAREILRRLASLSITTWNYKTQEEGIRHIGPMAQDFASAFKVGEDERHITTIDADGVALAAIKGLNEKVESENALLREELKRRDVENAELKGRMERLEQLLLNPPEKSIK